CRSTPTASSRPAGRRTVLVAVDDVRAERRAADRDVLGALRPWGGVAHPLARRRMYGLTCGDVEAAAFVLAGERAPEHQCVLVELGALPGLAPPGRTAHESDAHAVRSGVDPTDVLVNGLRWFAD